MDSIINSKKFITIRELQDMGFTYYKIAKMIREGYLTKVNRSTYENMAYRGEENDYFSAEAFVPNGVICLMSAARYYELTSFLPDAVEVAIHRKSRVSTLPEWPKIKLYYFDQQRMDTGVREICEGDNRFHIFDVEKTVVDIVYYRNKLGIEETKEIIKNYLKRRDRDIERLYAYSKVLRCEKVLRTYLEVLI